MGSFVTPYNIANQALQMLGVPRITNFSDASRQAQEASFVYDKARRAELRRFVWTFATRRAIIRPVTTTIKALTFPAYAAGTTYAAGDVVSYLNTLYTSLAGSNVGNTPGEGGFSPSWEVYYGPLQAEAHSTSTTYFPGDMVVASSTVYRAVNMGSFTNQTPPNATYWMAPTGVTAALPFTPDPMGFDPPGGTATRTRYRLPANFLRLAPQDPKAPAVARLGTTAGLNFNDWEIEAGYLVSAATTGGLIFRFVADTQVVTAMDDMFCMAVACRMALLMNQQLTGRTDLNNELMQQYARFVREAQAISAIEGGTTEADINVPVQQEQQPAQRGR